MIIHYNPNLKKYSRELRKYGLLSEAKLWNQLKGKKIKGYQFTRQKPIDEYIVDFYCSKLKLIIEIDGITHSNTENLDIIRQNKLESLGFKIIRFYDKDVRDNIDGVITYINNWIEKEEQNTPPYPPFLRWNLELT